MRKFTKLIKESQNNKDMWNIIPNSIKELNTLFKDNNYRLLLVGGCIRDFLNNESPKDFDLCTDALPEQVLKIIGNKYKVTSHGQSFGVVVIYPEDQPKGIEIATWRSDDYDGKLGITRNPSVKFSNLTDDAFRRDITYNGLYYDLTTHKIIDIVNGIEDLKNGVTKFIGDPLLRIKEDALRILRLLRFNCRYQFTIDDETKEVIKNNIDLLKIITMERIWTLSGDNTGEIQKGFKQSKNFLEYLSLVKELNIDKIIFGGLKNNFDFKNKFTTLSQYISFILKDNSIDNLNKVFPKLRFENEFTRQILFYINFKNLNDNDILEFYKRYKVSLIKESELLEWIYKNNMKDVIYHKFLSFKPTVNIEELIKSGLKGEELGKEIKRLEIENFKKLK